MKPNVPRSWFSLPSKEKDAIVAYCRSVAQDSIKEDEAELQILRMKMCCIILSNMGLDENRLYEFLGSWKAMYRKNARIQTKEEQDSFLKAEMERIFPENGFPEEFVRSLKEV